MYHNSLIHLSADGHIGCFHVLAVVNSAAMNIGVHVPNIFKVWFFPGYIPRVGLLDHIAVVFLDF